MDLRGYGIPRNNCLDMDMDMDEIFHLHRKPANIYNCLGNLIFPLNHSWGSESLSVLTQNY